MDIGLFHGYELKGSGSNEYTQYLARAFVAHRHNVHLMCREYNHAQFPMFTKVIRWDERGIPTLVKEDSDADPQCVLHELPKGSVYPVYLTDKQREGNVKAFINLTDQELQEFDRVNVRVITAIMLQNKMDILHCNHMLYQSEIARKVCKEVGVPFVVYPHGSCIEYTVKLDNRFKVLADRVIQECDGLILGNDEMESRLLKIYPEKKKLIETSSQVVGVGVDTRLFNPVSKSDRDHAIGKLAYQKLGGGKSPEMYAELCHELNQGNITCLKTFMSRYDRRLPDEGVYEKLSVMDWSRPTLIFAGALTVGKGLQSLITALPAIVKEIENVQLVIVGAGAYREVLEALIHAIETRDLKLLRILTARGYDLDANDLTGPWEDVSKYIYDIDNLEVLFEYGKDLKDRITFTGYLQHESLKHLFPCADLAVFPSVVAEAYPLVLMESLSNGVVPVVSDFAGFRSGLNDLAQFFDSQIHSCMKIPMDPRIRMIAFIDNIIALLQNPKVSAMQEYLHKVAVENYDWSLRAVQMVDAYGKVLKSTKRTRRVA